MPSDSAVRRQCSARRRLRRESITSAGIFANIIKTGSRQPRSKRSTKRSIESRLRLHAHYSNVGSGRSSVTDLFSQAIPGDFEARAVVPARELGAYEAIWAREGTSFKTIAD